MSSCNSWKLQAICLAISLFYHLSVGAQCRLEGTVTNQAGQPLEGAGIFIADLQKGSVSDADGRFIIESINPGTYTVEGSFLGYQSNRQRLVVSAGESVCKLNFKLAEISFTTQELLVTAVRVDERTPVTYTTLSRADLAPRNLGQDAPFLMQWTPSAVVTSDAGTGIGYTGIWIRGSDPTRTNITINGIPLNDAESQAVFWVNLPDFLSSAEEIQIQRGVGASTNGPGAFGATININTQKVYEKPYMTLDGTAGSFNTYRSSMRFGTGLMKGKFTLDGRLSNIQSDGYIDRASADLRAWFMTGAYIGTKSTFRINVFQGKEKTYQAWYGVPATLANDRATRTFNPAGTEKDGEPYDNEVDDYGQTHLQLLYNTVLGPQWQLNLAAYYTQGAGFFEQYKADEDPASYNLPSLGEPQFTDLIRRRWLDNDLIGGTFGLRFDHPVKKWQFTWGGAYSNYIGQHFGEVIWARFAAASEIRHRYYDNDGIKNDFNTFIRLNYPLSDRLEVFGDLQLRSVDYRFEGYGNRLQLLDQRENLLFFNPKAGFTYKLPSGGQAYLGFGIAQREPNRNDYVDNPPVTRPLPEKLYNVESGWRFRTNRTAGEVNAFYMLYHNQLAINGQLNDVGEYMRINIARSYRYGLELSGAHQLTKVLSLQGNLALSQNRVVSFEEYVDRYDADFNYLGQQAVERTNTPLSFSPSVVAAADITYRQPIGKQKDRTHFETALQTKYVSRRYLDNAGDRQNSLDPFTFADCRIGFQHRTAADYRIRLNFVVQNVFDAMYSTNGWSYRYLVGDQLSFDQGLYPQAGRNWLLALGFDF